MKRGAQVFVVALLMSHGLFPCAAQPALLAAVTDGETIHVALRLDPNQSVTWLKVGESTGSYALKSFDVKREIAVLESRGNTLELRLPQSRIKPLVDLGVVEALAKAGNQRLTELLQSYRKYEAIRQRMLASASSRKDSGGPAETAKRTEFIRWLESDDHPNRMRLIEGMSQELMSLPQR